MNKKSTVGEIWLVAMPLKEDNSFDTFFQIRPFFNG